jgi:exosome complex RNA-binding protein Csl4
MTREEAIKTLKGEAWSFGSKEYKEAFDMAIKALEQEPKTGHWIDITNKNKTVIAVRCSRCEKSPKYAIKSDFCPNCGAEMRGGE